MDDRGTSSNSVLALRLQLAWALLDGGEAEQALEQFVSVLGIDAANLDALKGAAAAAAALGDRPRAESYERLVSALSGATASPASGSVGEVSDQPRRRERLKVVGRDPETNVDWMDDRPTITLDDVAGMDAVKRRLQVAFLGPLRNPELRRLYGKSLRGGLLLYGPPGCGKTFLARATAGELGARFISVGLSDVLDMWLGESERNLHTIFENARRSAPAVIFFDEVDALGQRRSHLRHSAGRNVVAQFLAELDGVDQANDGIFVLAASNHPWDIDTALLRPGRLDRLALVLPPDQPAREAILRLHLAERPVANVDPAALAAQTDEFSGADLAHLCESASELALEDSLVTGVPRAIVMDDFRNALRELRPSTRQWFEMARNFAMYANEGGVYDELLSYMRARKLL
jgi:SpoVK/Ycf46/Vps4 family AAA+-type ATPase